MASYSVNNGSVTYNLPDEGTVFRNTADINGDAVYKVVNGKLTTVASPSYTALTKFSTNGQTYNAGDAIGGNPHEVQFLDPNYRGAATSPTSAFDVYKTQTGQDANSLPTFNLADIQSVLDRNNGVLPSTAKSEAYDPAIQNYTNPNANFQNTGSTAGFTNNVPQPAATYPAQSVNQGATPPTTDPSGIAPGTAPVTPQNVATAQTQQNTQTVQPPNVALQPGNTGPAVKQLQDYLVSLKLMTPEQVATGPGIYGPQTTAAVAALQQQLGVDNSSGPGYFGPKTQAALSQYTQSQTQGTGASGGTQSSGTTQPGTQNTTQADGTDPYAGLSPIQKQIQMYQDTYKALGLSDIKTAYQKFVDDEANLQKELAGKIADVNANPWYSEGVRVKEVEKLQNKYKTDLDILTNKATLMDALYKEGQLEADHIVSGANADIKTLNEIAQKKIDAQDKLAELNTTTVEADGRKFLVTYDGKGNVKNKVDIGASSSGSGGGSGLTPAQINATVNSIASSFDNEPVVKQFNVLNEGYQFAKSLSNTTQNPADDQGLIYAFAKAMDPNSVVREGEYATVQKYAQSWAKQYGGTINQALNGTGFLSTAARQSIKDTIATKYQASLANYQNVYDQYQQRIQQAQNGGYNSITDYSKAYGGSSNSSAYSPGTQITKDHIIYLVGSDGDTLTPIGSAL